MGQLGQINEINAFGVLTYANASGQSGRGMFHGNHRKVAGCRGGIARVLPDQIVCGQSSAQFSHMFGVPNLVPGGTGVLR